MNEWQDIAESYKEASELAEKMIIKQTEIIGSLEQQISLYKQKELTDKKKITVLLSMCKQRDDEFSKAVVKAIEVRK